MHYEWVNAAFKDTKITGTDFDCVIERCGHFLVIESKDRGVSVPVGQMLTLQRLWALRNCTIFVTSPKDYPERIKIVWEKSFKLFPEIVRVADAAQATRLVRFWRKLAEKKPKYFVIDDETSDFFNEL